MCAYIHACVCLHVYASICASVLACANVYMYFALVRINLRVCACTCVHLCEHLRASACVCVHAYEFASIRVRERVVGVHGCAGPFVCGRVNACVCAF